MEQPEIIAHALNPSAHEAESGRGQLGLHSKFQVS